MQSSFFKDLFSFITGVCFQGRATILAVILYPKWLSLERVSVLCNWRRRKRRKQNVTWGVPLVCVDHNHWKKNKLIKNSSHAIFTLHEYFDWQVYANSVEEWTDTADRRMNRCTRYQNYTPPSSANDNNSNLTLVLLNPDIPDMSCLCKQCRSRSVGFTSAMFAIKYVNLYQKSGSNNLIGCKLEMGVAS